MAISPTSSRATEANCAEAYQVASRTYTENVIEASVTSSEVGWVMTGGGAALTGACVLVGGGAPCVLVGGSIVGISLLYAVTSSTAEQRLADAHHVYELYKEASQNGVRNEEAAREFLHSLGVKVAEGLSINQTIVRLMDSGSLCKVTL